MDDLNLDNDDKQNVIIEINKSVEDTLYDEDQIVSEENTLIVKKDKKKKNKVNKNKKKFSWKNLTKKEKAPCDRCFSILVNCDWFNLIKIITVLSFCITNINIILQI